MLPGDLEQGSWDMKNCTIETVDNRLNNNNIVLDQDDLTNLVTDSPIPGKREQLYWAKFTKLGYLGFLFVS